MPLRVFCLGVVFAGAVLLLGANDVPTSSLEPSVASRVAATALSPPDTLRAAVPPGTPLIRSLPLELNGSPVTKYTLLSGPALSGVAGRSFTWIPTEVEPGRYDVLLNAHRASSVDTLVIRIDVQS